MDRKALQAIWTNIGADVPVSEGMENFHLGVLSKFTGLQALARRRMAKLDPDLSAPVKRARQSEILQGIARRLQAEVEFESKGLRARREEIQAAIKAKVRPAMPDDPIQAMRAEAHILALRRELAEVPTAERPKVLWDAAQRGLPGLLEAVEGGLRPLLSEDLLPRLESVYSEAVAPQESQWLEAAEAMVAEAERAAAFAVPAMAADLVKNDRIDSTWQKMTPAQLAAAWPQERKAAFLAGHGQEAYERLLRTGEGYEFPADHEPIPSVV